MKTWIPCNKKLPPYGFGIPSYISDEVIVTYEVSEYFRLVSIDSYNHKTRKWLSGRNVVAWMDKPQPFTESEQLTLDI